jgi:ribosomal protein RSM22 (predicted rRNA methylase)
LETFTEATRRLSAGVAGLAAGTSERRLAEVTRCLSDGYRGPQIPGPLDRDEAVAYCVYRLPATHGAVWSALALLRAACPDFEPESMLDVGGGPGTGAMAALSVFPSLRAATILDANDVMLRVGKELAAGAPALFPSSLEWTRADLPPPAGGSGSYAADLVVLSYVIGELVPEAREALTDFASSAGRAVVVVEPGTPAGYSRVLAARQRLLEHGRQVAAPCPHDRGCPVAGDDWCHFSVRVPRSHLHRVAKGGDLGHEDEKYSFVAAVDEAPARSAGRIVRHPTWRKSMVTLVVCESPPAIARRIVTKSAGAPYRAARAARWGDPWPDVLSY